MGRLMVRKIALLAGLPFLLALSPSGAWADTLWVCAANDSNSAAPVTKYRLDGDKIYDLTAIEFWISSIKPVDDDQREKIEADNTLHVVEDTAIGLVAMQGEAKLYGDYRSVSASIIMLNKVTGGFRRLSLEEQLADQYGQPTKDMAERGQCTLVNSR
jgi:hypothetical protein